MHPSVIQPDRYNSAEETHFLAAEGYASSAALSRAIKSAAPTPPAEGVNVHVRAFSGGGNAALVPTTLLPDVVKTLAEDPEVAYFEVGTRRSSR